MLPTGHDGDTFADPGVRLRDGGVSHALLLPELLLGVAVAGRSSEAACADAEEDDADGFDVFTGDAGWLQGDWLADQEGMGRDRNRDGNGIGLGVARKIENSQKSKKETNNTTSWLGMQQTFKYCMTSKRTGEATRREIPRSLAEDTMLHLHIIPDSSTTKMLLLPAGCSHS